MGRGSWRLAAGQQVPERFYALLFWAGVAVGTIWFVRVERGVSRSTLPTRHIMQ